ncbi:hypothetical protein ACXZ1K_09635 [Pedobacter sp. PWIIR3]
MKLNKLYLVKRILLLAMFMLNWGSIFAQYPFNTPVKMPAGKISSFTESSYDQSSGHPVLIKKSTFTFDVRGNLVEQLIYDTIDSNVIENKIVYNYENDQLIAEKDKYSVKKYLYDVLGNRTAMKQTTDSSSILIRYLYNLNKLVEQRVQYDEDGKLNFEEKFGYNLQSRLISKDVLIPDSLAKSYYANYTYDLKGNVVNDRIYALNNHIRWSNVYDYDQYGNLTEQKRLNETGAEQWRISCKYAFDKLGNWSTLTIRRDKNHFFITRKINYRPN